MKQQFLCTRTIVGTLGVLWVSLSGAIAGDAVPVGEHAVPVGEHAVPVGEHAVPVGEHAVPVGEHAVPVGEHAVPIGEGAVPIGEHAVPVGEGAVPVGEHAVPVGEHAVPVGEHAVPVGEDAVPVGEDAVPVGEHAVPVGEGAVPVGEEARLTNTVDRQNFRLKSRAAAMKHPDTAHLFKGDAASRPADVEKRLYEAARKTPSISADAIARRKAENKRWARGVLASAQSRPSNLFTEKWWKGVQGKLAGTRSAFFATQPASTWWQAASWKDLASAAGLDEAAKPFVYVYDGNITFKSDVIYVNDQPVASYENAVAAALRLANSGAGDAASEADWTPIGIFALSNSIRKMDAPQAIQLGMDRKGNIAGVYVNWPAGHVIPIYGKVDPKTQRVAFNIGKNNNVTFTVGLANLAANEMRLWVHLPNMHSQTWLAVRMKQAGK